MNLVDINSEAEPGREEPKGDDDCNALRKLLNAVDKATDGSDEVVVVKEVKPNPKPESKSWKPTDKDEDDDCVVLDGDPDNPVPVVDDNDPVSGSEELLIVGEKGQIACRDYPHPRHLCAKFPFNSSPHERHCDMCHCYVCDSLVPCIQWGSGMSVVDHCHASDREEKWKLQRKSFKQGIRAPIPVSKFPNTSLSVLLQANQVSQPNQVPQLCQVPQLNQVPPLDIIQLAPNSTPQNHFGRPTMIRDCYSSTNFGIPNIIMQGRNQQSGYFAAKNKFQPLLDPQQLLGLNGNVIRKERGHNIGNLGSQSVSSRTMFKRAASVGGALTTSRSGYGSSNSTKNAHASQHLRNPTSTVTSNDRNSVRWQNMHPGIKLVSDTYQSLTQPNIASIYENTVPSQSQVYSQHIPQVYTQHFYQPGNQTQITTDPVIADLNFGWDVGQGHQQSPVENCPPQSAGTTCEPSPVKKLGSEFSGVACLSSLDELEKWLLED